MKASVLILLATVVGSTACVTEIADVATFKTMKSEVDLIIDVRNWDEYTGSGDASCNSGNDKNKCNYGHHTDMFFLENPYREDKAVVFKVNGSNTVEMAVIEALVACFGGSIADTKVMTSCHSGSRSGFFQDKLVEAGFACGNIYNFVPGARGLYDAWQAGDASLEMTNGTGSPGVFDYSTCPADKTGVNGSSEVSGAPGVSSWGFGLTASLLIGILA